MAGTPEIPQSQPGYVDHERQIAPSDRLLRYEHEILPPSELDIRAREIIQGVYTKIAEMYFAGDPDVFASLAELYEGIHPEAKRDQDIITPYSLAVVRKPADPNEFFLVAKNRGNEKGQITHISVVRDQSLHIVLRGGKPDLYFRQAHVFAATSTAPAHIEGSLHYKSRRDFRPVPNTEDAIALVGDMIEYTVVPFSPGETLSFGD